MDQWSAGLMLSNRCGDIECSEYQLCSEFDRRCHPCQSYCDKTSNNFDLSICQQQCQNFIHDFLKHYVKDSDYQDELEILKLLVICMTGLVVFALVLVLISLVFLWTGKRNIQTIKNGVKQSVSTMLVDNAAITVNEMSDNPQTGVTIKMKATGSSLTNKPPNEEVTIEMQGINCYDNIVYEV